MTLDHLGNVDMIDVKEAARRLGTKERFVRRLVSERRIRFYKYEGGYVRFDPNDIAEYIRQGRVDAIQPVLTYRKGGHAYA
ncbi:MAG: helix-turn-helix domain-containing protein [Micromonosporaceae bacterium]